MGSSKLYGAGVCGRGGANSRTILGVYLRLNLYEILSHIPIQIYINPLQLATSRVYTPLMRLSVGLYVCLCITLFFEFFCVTNNDFILMKQKTTKRDKKLVLFSTIFLSEMKQKYRAGGARA